MESLLESSISYDGNPARCTRTCKIIMIGDAGVGKTCLTHRFCTGHFPSRTEATIGLDFREKLLEFEGERIRVQLWDTAGQERFRKCMVQHYYRNVHGIVFVFDVTNPSSFCNLPSWMDECHQHCLGLDIPRALVCNKADLASSTTSVLIEQARHLAEVHRMSFFLTSAKGHRGEQLDSIFVTLAQKSKKQRGQGVNGCMLVSGRSESFKIPARGKTKEDVRRWDCSCF